MTEHYPDYWVLLEIPDEYSGEPLLKILAGWSGGYLDGDSWRLSSGVVDIKELDDAYLITNCSGSIYQCLKCTQKLGMATSGVYDNIKRYTPDVCIHKLGGS